MSVVFTWSADEARVALRRLLEVPAVVREPHDGGVHERIGRARGKREAGHQAESPEQSAPSHRSGTGVDPRKRPPRAHWKICSAPKRNVHSSSLRPTSKSP